LRLSPASAAITRSTSAQALDETYQHAIQQWILEDDTIASPRSLQAKRNTFGESQGFDATLESEETWRLSWPGSWHV